jgi:peptide/nickel transport system substrate-binding protein
VSFGGATQSDKLDPALLNDFFEAFAGGLLFDSLVAVNSNNQPIPALAESWDHSTDGRTWRFKLRRGVQFHNGRSFTSADAAFSISRLLDPKLGSGAFPQFAPILSPSGIRPHGRYEIVFHLKAPDAFFPTLLSTFYPRMLPTGTTSAEVNAKAIGTGPFKLVSFTAGTELQVVRNPNYWQSGRPYLDGVKLAVITDQATKLDSVLTGQADACDSVQFSSYAQVQSSSAARLLTAPGSTFMTYIANQRDGANKDVRVRQALKYGINRQQIVDQVFFGHALASADVPIPPGDMYYPTAVKPFPYEPDRARSLLKQAGYRDGIKGVLLTAPVAAGMTDIAQVIQQQAASAGIGLSIRQLPVGTYYSVATGKPYYIDYWIREHVSLMLPQMYGPTSPPTANESFFDNAKVTRLIPQAQATFDVAKQKEIYAEIFHIANETSGQMIPCHVNSGWAVKNNLHGVQLNNANYATFTNAFLA